MFNLFQKRTSNDDIDTNTHKVIESFQLILFHECKKSLVENKLKFNIDNTIREIAKEYIKYICFIEASAIFKYKLKKKNYTEESEEVKSIRRVLLNYTKEFTKQYFTTNLIKYIAKHDLKDNDYLLLQVLNTFKEYETDLNDYFSTGKIFVEVENRWDDDDITVFDLYNIFIRDLYLPVYWQNNNTLEIHFRNFSEISITIEEMDYDPKEDINKMAKTLLQFK